MNDKNDGQNSSTQRVQAVLLTNTGNVPLRVLSLGRTRALVRTTRPVRLPNKIRIGFAHHGEHPGRILMLATVSSLQDNPESTMLKLDYVAIHSMDGKECLREFVSRDLGHQDIFESSFSYGRGGFFYRLDESHAPPKEESPEVDGASQRREERIPVRVPLSFDHPTGHSTGEAYNVSYNGVFILTEDELPPKGTVIEVSFPIRAQYDTHQVKFSGIVCWTGSGMTSAHGGGIGLQIDQWSSTDDSKLWQSYVRHEIEFSSNRR